MPRSNAHFEISEPFNPVLTSAASSAHLAKYFEAPEPRVPNYTPRLLNHIIATTARGIAAHELLLVATQPAKLWTRIKTSVKGHLGFKQLDLTEVLEHFGFQFRLLQSYVVDGDIQAPAGETKEIDALWMELLQPVTAIAQLVASASYKHSNKHSKKCEIYKLNGIHFAGALEFIATELGHVTLMLDRKLGDVTRGWTERTVVLLSDTGDRWLDDARKAKAGAPIVPVVEEVRSSSSSEALVRRMNQNRINDNIIAMNRYPIPPPAAAGPSAAPRAQRASIAASIEPFPAYLPVPRTPPGQQGWF